MLKWLKNYSDLESERTRAKEDWEKKIEKEEANVQEWLETLSNHKSGKKSKKHRKKQHTVVSEIATIV